MNPHIIQVITELEPAGAERVLADLSVNLLERNCSVSVISLQSEPKVKTILNILKSHNIEVFFLNVTKTTPWRIFKLSALIEKIRRDNKEAKLIVHSHLMHANLACRLAKIYTCKFPLVNTIHITERRYRQIPMFLLDKLTLSKCNAYTAVSEASANWHAHKLNINNAYIKVIYNGIRKLYKITDKTAILLKREWGMSACNKIIGSIGRLDWQKGYDFLFKILPELSAKIPENEIWGVVILGEGRQRNELESLAKKVPDNIKILMPGYREDAAECIGAFDLFVMPSRYEGFGLALLEAMHFGLPVLVNEIETLIYFLRSYPNGKQIDFSNSNISVQSILEYIGKEHLSNYCNEFTIEKMVDEYIKTYNSII